MVLDHRYRLVSHLGSGGMGSVYLAEHPTLGRKFAIKVLNPELSAHRDFAERFLREARAATAIDHPHVIEVVDTGYLPDGTPYYAMEHLQGEDLARTLRTSGRLAWPRVHHIALQICDALASAHAKGIIHRDLKPENCFRITRGRDQDFIKVLDFGIAKLVGPPGSSLTNTGELLGTAYYMAPEQAMGQKIDHRVDIYALGAMLYQLLTGRVPFDGRNNIEVLAALLTRTPEPIHALVPNADVPLELGDIVERAMQKEAGWRFSSMDAFAEALSRIPLPAPPVAAPAPEQPATATGLTTPAEGQLPFDRTVVAPERPPPDDPAGSTPPLGMLVAHTPVELSFHPKPAPAPLERRPTHLRWIAPLLALTAGGITTIFLALQPLTKPTTLPDEPPASTPAAPTSTKSTPAPITPPPEPPISPAPEPEPPPEPTPPSPLPVEPTKSAPLPAATKPRPKPPVRPKPEKDVQTVLDDVSRDIRAACHSRFGDRMAVRVTIAAATGKLLTRRLLPPHEESNRVWSCISGQLDRASFTPFTGADYTGTINLEITPQP